jgi:5-formyltetrahydrofolate cyclo-ligase
MSPTTDQPANHTNAMIRRALRSKRRKLSELLRKAHDVSIRQHLMQLTDSKKFNSIAAFWSFDGEPDVIPLCRQMISSGKEIALPVISSGADVAMKFHLWQAETILKPNKFGIYEPQETETVDLADFDLLLIPLVAYDCKGSRIGMGSGYYDRHLETIRDLPSPLRVGLAYGLQEIDLINKNKWDIPLHGVVNETGWFTFRP